MKHHFADFLDRNDDYWTLIPNRERYSYSVKNAPENPDDIKIITIGNDDEKWEDITEYKNLEEVTLHEPSKKQLEVVSKLINIKRLRVTYLRTKNIDFISSLINVEELVLEYVSGFSDLGPLRKLKKLKSLHIENLRKVSDFSGLSGIDSLTYLRIDGTFDWKQPISDFEFLRGLPNIEVISFGQVINKTEFPAFWPLLSLQKLKKLLMTNNMFAAKEYALLTVGKVNVEGADWPAFTKVAYSKIPLPKNDFLYLLAEDNSRDSQPEITVSYSGEKMISNPDDEWFEFTGKNAGKIKTTSSKSEAKCIEYTALYEAMKKEASVLINEKL